MEIWPVNIRDLYVTGLKQNLFVKCSFIYTNIFLKSNDYC
uniref:Uncharacterized protein n=1 Tax=uncultured Desulfobacterium sp. TaxID=201089 RepID=E1YI23_9BACT|nr:unknown protein [uncultured Desulfobacterium sp.]